MEIIAHRGASYDAPENTLASIQRAWQQQADAVEIDVVQSKDRQIVVFHDETTERLAGRDQAVDDQTLAELQTLDVGCWKGNEWASQRIPTLEQALETIPDGKRMFIEIKTGPEIVPQLLKVLEKGGHPPNKTAIIGYSLAALRELTAAAEELQLYWVAQQSSDRSANKWVPSIDHLIGQAIEAQLDGLDLCASGAINERSVAAIKLAGLQVYVWTVNAPVEAARLKNLGVHGVTTDRPGWIRQQLASFGNGPLNGS